MCTVVAMAGALLSTVTLVVACAAFILLALFVTPDRAPASVEPQLRVLRLPGAPTLSVPHTTEATTSGFDPGVDVGAIVSFELSRDRSTVDLVAAVEAAASELTADSSSQGSGEITLDSTATPTAPSPTPTPTPAPAMTPAQTLELTHVFIDLQRSLAGLGGLERSPVFDELAQRHAEDLAANERFSHIGSDGSTLADRLDRAGIEDGWAGENLGRSSRADADSVRAIIAGFMNSPSHRDNVLGAHYRVIGLGIAFDADGSAILAVLFFG